MEFTLTFLTHLRFNFTSMQQVQTLLFVGFKDGAQLLAEVGKMTTFYLRPNQVDDLAYLFRKR